METWECGCHAPISLESSYRTYEEWKHMDSVVYVYSDGSSYRTYEEWKRLLTAITTY